MLRLTSAITCKIVRVKAFVGVKTSGCSGLAYVLEFVDDIDTHDQVFEQLGVKVFVDPKAGLSQWFRDGLC
jgi:Fe-S cluster assembly iron-binding protein IscA